MASSYLNVIDKILGSVDSTTDVFFGKLQRWVLDKASFKTSLNCGVKESTTHAKTVHFLWEWCGFSDELIFLDNFNDTGHAGLYDHKDYIAYTTSKGIDYTKNHGIRYLKYEIYEYSDEIKEVASESSGYITKVPLNKFEARYEESWFNADNTSEPSGPDGTTDPIQCLKEGQRYYLYIRAIKYIPNAITRDADIGWAIHHSLKDKNKILNFISGNGAPEQGAESFLFYKKPFGDNVKTDISCKCRFQYPIEGLIPYYTDNPDYAKVTVPIGAFIRLYIEYKGSTPANGRRAGKTLEYTETLKDIFQLYLVSSQLKKEGSVYYNIYSKGTELELDQTFILLEGFIVDTNDDYKNSVVLAMRIA